MGHDSMEKFRRSRVYYGRGGRCAFLAMPSCSKEALTSEALSTSMSYHEWDGSCSVIGINIYRSKITKSRILPATHKVLPPFSQKPPAAAAAGLKKKQQPEQSYHPCHSYHSST